MRTLVLALVCACITLACGRPRNVERDHIRFAHGPHVRVGISCTQCHERGRTSAPPTPTDGSDAMVMPSEAQCRSCHTAPAQQACGYCHSTPLAPQRYERADRQLRFSHAAHAARGERDCLPCHAVGADLHSTATFEPRIPTMDACATRCHSEAMRALNCELCHVSLARYTIDEITTPRHPAGFARHHGVEARASANTCSQCHDPSYCERCHAPSPGLPALEDIEPMAVDRDFVHRGDFMARHPEEAEFSTTTCLRCHGVESCDGCHEASGIGGGVGRSSAHPPGWLNPSSPNSHARAARRDLLSCVSCHEGDAVQVCTPCHRVGGSAGNPHPPGFSAGIDAMQHAVCLACHAGGH